MPKISGLTALTTPASNDLVPIVDVNDTTMATSGTTKQATVQGLASGLAATSNTPLAKFPLDSFTGTDDAKFTSALAAITALAGNGEVTLGARSHSFAGQWITHLVGVTKQYIRIAGQGAGPAVGDSSPIATTVCDMTLQRR